MFFSRGWFGEKIVMLNIWLTLDVNIYPRFHNVIIPSNNGTSQIDHLLISQYGIFIVETKNIKGWIFGSYNQPQWTQVIYGSKYSFQNPTRQTFRQKKVLANYLAIDETLIHSVIYFVGNCKFKTLLPSNVIRSGLSKYIKQFKKQLLTIEEINRVRENINKLKADPSLTTKNHIKSLRTRYNSTTICPKCGSGLIERTAKKGNEAGSRFLGCVNYPQCRYTQNIS